MIVTSITHWCPACQSTNIVKNGHTTYGQQRCLCHGCGKTRVLVPRRDSALDRFMEKALRERISLRGIARVFGVSLQTVLVLLQRLAQALPALRSSLMPAQAKDILELDELYSFVGSKKHKRWLWVALCRRTRQVVAYVIGDRSDMPTPAPAHRVGLSPVCELQRFLGRLCEGVPERKASIGGQGQRRDSSCRAVELHAQTKGEPVRAKDVVVFQD